MKTACGSVGRFVIALALGLLLIDVAHVAVEAQEPVGYWLYVDSAWKGGFARRAECDAAAAKTTGKQYECRALYPRAVPPGQQPAPTMTREPTYWQADPGQAELYREQDQRAQNEKWASDVKACSETTGAEAFVSGPGHVEFLGKARANFEFTRCMTKRGNQLTK